MSDETPAPKTPIVVSSSPVADNPGALMRDLMIVLGTLPALVSVFGTHDTLQIVSYVASSQFAQALGIVLTAGAVAWRQLLTWKRQRDSKRMASNVADTIAIVKPSLWARIRAVFA